MGKINDLKDSALSSLRGKWGSFVGLTFVYLLITAIVNVFSNSGTRMMDSNFGGLGIALSLIGLVAAILIFPMQYGYNIAHLNASRQDMPAQIDDLFIGYKRFGKVLGTMLIYAIIVFLGTILLIVPGIILAISYAMWPFILHDNPELSATDALAASREMMKGHKMDYFLLILSFIGWILLGILTLCIGYLWLSPYMTMTQFKFYEQLRSANQTESIIEEVSVEIDETI